MPPSSPGESGTGSPEAESTGSGREDETATGPRPKKARRGSRAPHPLPNQRKASGGGGPGGEESPSGSRVGRSNGEALMGDVDE